MRGGHQALSNDAGDKFVLTLALFPVGGDRKFWLIIGRIFKRQRRKLRCATWGHATVFRLVHRFGQRDDSTDVRLPSPTHLICRFHPMRTDEDGSKIAVIGLANLAYGLNIG